MAGSAPSAHSLYACPPVRTLEPQVEICGKLTWTRNDCYNGITSIRVINENVVAAKQRAAAVAVWNRCNVDKKSLGTECLRQDFTKKLTDKVPSFTHPIPCSSTRPQLA